MFREMNLKLMWIRKTYNLKISIIKKDCTITVKETVKDFFLFNLSFFTYVCAAAAVFSAALIMVNGSNYYISAIKCLVNYTFPEGLCTFKNHICFGQKPPFWTDPLTICLQTEGKNQLRHMPCGMTLTDKDSKAVFIASLDQVSKNLHEISNPKLFDTDDFLKYKKKLFKIPLYESQMFVTSHLDRSFAKLIKSLEYNINYTLDERQLFRKEYSNLKANVFLMHQDLAFIDCSDSFQKKKHKYNYGFQQLLRNKNITSEQYRLNYFKDQINTINTQNPRLVKIDSKISELKTVLGRKPRELELPTTAEIRRIME